MLPHAMRLVVLLVTVEILLVVRTKGSSIVRLAMTVIPLVRLVTDQQLTTV